MPQLKTINYKFLLYLYNAAFLKRWNDQVRAVDFREIDKQAQKFIIAYLIGKMSPVKSFDWHKLIEAGVFEFLQRLTLTDFKPQLFHRIEKDVKTYKELINYSKEELDQYFIDKKFLDAYEKYLLDKINAPTIYHRIMDAANYLASWEEFVVIQRTNPDGYDIAEIEQDLTASIKKATSHLKSAKEVENDPKLRRFIQLCGQLRYQIRWSHTYRVPETSVLGHMLIVAIITYLLKSRNDEVDVCFNNFFTALFHDLPEALTRDVIRPIKQVGKMSDLVKKFEHDEMKRRVYPLLPPNIAEDIKYFTVNEFTVQEKNGRILRNGDLIKAIDHLAAYLEAYLALQNGITNKKLSEARISLTHMYAGKIICGVDFGVLYKALEKNF
ncbi:MAG: HD domain-containing protein [Patescibacteria group bacterium]|jgi:putative hydrolase of HD superfamily